MCNMSEMSEMSSPAKKLDNQVLLVLIGSHLIWQVLFLSDRTGGLYYLTKKRKAVLEQLKSEKISFILFL